MKFFLDAPYVISGGAPKFSMAAIGNFDTVPVPMTPCSRSVVASAVAASQLHCFLPHHSLHMPLAQRLLPDWVGNQPTFVSQLPFQLNFNYDFNLHSPVQLNLG